MRIFLVFILATIVLSLEVTEANACPAAVTFVARNDRGKNRRNTRRRANA
jgi:hypothetical protein